MASTITTFAFAIKDRFDKVSFVENLTLAERPLLAMINKDEDFQGDGTHIPLIYGNPQGIAASGLATAQANATNVQGKKFILTAGDYQGSVDIGDKVITASRGNPGAFLKNKAAEMDGLYEQMADNLATYLYGNSGNSLGVIASVSVAGGTTGGDRVFLTEPTQTINFEVGMRLDTWDNDGSDSPGTNGDTGLLVDGVNRAEGSIDIAPGSSPISGGAGDFLFRTGDYGASGNFIFHGLGSFLWPDNNPPPIYSMSRTDDTIRLAGSRVPAADLVGLNIEERIQLLGAYMTGRYKGPGPTHGFCNPEDWQNLSNSLQSRGIRPLKDDTTRFNFQAIEVVLGGKMVRIYPDRFCPRGTFFALRMKDWTLHSMLKLIHPISQDGLVLLRKGTSNDYEYRIVSYPAVVTVAPGWSGRVALSS
jgi:hypothetical protein